MDFRLVLAISLLALAVTQMPWGIMISLGPFGLVALLRPDSPNRSNV
jgi:hypothetical protein